MSQQRRYEGSQQPHSFITDGFSVLRPATGSDIDVITTGLKTLAVVRRGIEVRAPGIPKKEPGLQIINTQDVRGKKWPNPHIFIADIYEKILEEVPSLGETRTWQLTRTHPHRDQRNNGHFLVAYLGGESLREAVEERSLIIGALEKVAGYRHPPQDWGMSMGVTLAYVNNRAPGGSISAAMNVINDHVSVESPATADFGHRKFFPTLESQGVVATTGPIS